MRTMPTFFTDEVTEQVINVPIAAPDELARAIDLLAGGNLTPEEQRLVESASDHNWTIRIIVDELRERRGMVPVPQHFDWRTICEGEQIGESASKARRDD